MRHRAARGTGPSPERWGEQTSQLPPFISVDGYGLCCDFTEDGLCGCGSDCCTWVYCPCIRWWWLVAQGCAMAVAAALQLVALVLRKLERVVEHKDGELAVVLEAVRVAHLEQPRQPARHERRQGEGACGDELCGRELAQPLSQPGPQPGGRHRLAQQRIGRLGLTEGNGHRDRSVANVKAIDR